MTCSACISGHLHSGTPTGKVGKLHGLDVYTASPPEGVQPKGVVVFIPDAFGWEVPNNRLLADAYAKKGGFIVHLPDFMNGKSCDIVVMSIMEAMTEPGLWNNVKKIFLLPRLIYHFGPFLYANRLSLTMPRVESFLAGIRSDSSSKHLPVGAAGFCWGGKHVVLLCANTTETKLIDAGYTGHPSMLKVPDDFAALRLPLSIAVGDADAAWGIDSVRQAEAELRQLEEKEPSMKGKWEIKIYDGAKHGFTSRADEGDAKAAKQADEAGAQAVSWFSKWFETSEGA